MGAALHEERVRPLAHPAYRREQVFGEDDLEVRDPLEVEVMQQRVLVAGARRAERDEGRPCHRALPSWTAGGAPMSSSSILQVAPIMSSNSASVKSEGKATSVPRAR